MIKRALNIYLPLFVSSYYKCIKGFLALLTLILLRKGEEFKTESLKYLWSLDTLILKIYEGKDKKNLQN